ncbi:MAG: NAD(P)/FAD-dependent oxidoreductase [Pseudomonadota bacterium]
MEAVTKFDVAVVGGGPGGSAAAAKCAEAGLETLLLEKRKTPRNKVCTGMIMSDTAQSLVREVFGDLPVEVLTTPPYLLGIKFHAPAVRTLIFEKKMPFAWRKDLDYWMNDVSEKKGVIIWDKAKFKGLEEERSGYVLKINRKGKEEFVSARFLIGADGTNSRVQNALFAKIAMKCQLCIRQCYQGRVDLDAEHVHYFYFNDLTAFEVNRKGDVILVEITPRSLKGAGNDIIQRVEEWLIREFSISGSGGRLWRDGCLEPSMTQTRFSEPFPLCKGNALIVGNAAGLSKPITGEGIGTALKSGMMAAEAVISANKSGRKAETFYMAMTQDIVSELDSMYRERVKIGEAARRGLDCFLPTIAEVYRGITKRL